MHFGSAPRRVPLSLQIVNFFNGFSQIGWLVFGFGMIFFWVFALNGDFSFITFRGAHETVDGRVTSVNNTGASVNRVNVKANHYEYSVAGTLLSGTSYSNGERVSPGESVTVEYDEDHPSRSRIEGMRRAMFGPGVAMVSLFPLIGLLMLIPATLTGMKRNRLLREGIFTTGKLISKEPTNVTINHRPLFELRFEFTARDGRRFEAKARTTDTRRLEDEAQEALLYDPNDPSRAYVIDEAPARPELEPNGDLRGNPGRAVAVLILPAIMLSIHALLLLAKLM
jgi:transcriptional antiterminator Rof (Rho-off)